MKEPLPSQREGEIEASSTPVDELKQIRAENTETEDRIEYRVLTIDNYTERVEHEQGMLPSKFETDEDLRADYIARTERLMEKIVERDIDTVLYLDKSARPVSWFVRELWPVLMKGHQAPETKYANVDANAVIGLASTGARPSDDEMANFSFSDEQVAELRQTYADPQNPEATLFDGKRILIVDEIFVSGSTLKLAQKLFEEAFPDAHFEAVAWMYGDFVEDRRMSRRTLKEVPIWYHDTDVAGRGVGDAKDKHFLSSRYEGGDKLGDQLRAEIHQLAKDIVTGEQAIIPDTGRLEEGIYEGMKIRPLPSRKKASLFD